MVFFHLTTVAISSRYCLTNFTDKLPGKAKRIVGIILSTGATHDTKAICQVGISLNGGKQYPINQAIVSHRTDPFTKTFPLRMNILHDRNSLVNGYVEDLGSANIYPYNVKISFMLEDEL